MFTHTRIPGASEEQAGWLHAPGARATSTENAVGARAGAGCQTHVRDLLQDNCRLSRRTPCCDRMIDFAFGCELAARTIARLVPRTATTTSLVPTSRLKVFVDEVAAFLAPDSVAAGTPAGALRSIGPGDRRAAPGPGGRDNPEVARELALSVRTVERHLTNQDAKPRPHRAGGPGRGCPSAARRQLAIDHFESTEVVTPPARRSPGDRRESRDVVAHRP